MFLTKDQNEKDRFPAPSRTQCVAGTHLLMQLSVKVVTYSIISPITSAQYFLKMNADAMVAGNENSVASR